MEEKSNIKFDKLSKYFIGIAGLLLVFSLLAPIIFTQPQVHNKLDFTDTGTIGDTIGGIMNPFIAMAGVLATFLAFYMQMKANELQRKQFTKSLKTDFVNEKIDLYYKLELLKYDLKSIEDDVAKRVIDFEEYIISLEKQPFNPDPIRLSSLKKYSRLNIDDRACVFKLFKTFVKNIDSNWLNSFNNLYGIIDYISEALNHIYKITYEYGDHALERRKNLSDLLMDFDKKIVNLFKEVNYQEIDIHHHLFKFKELYAQELNKGANPDWFKIGKELESLVTPIKNSKEQYNDLLITIGLIRKNIEEIKLQSEQNLIHINRYIEDIYKRENSATAQLKNITNKLEEALSQTSPKQIRSELDI